jgi:hypothetical protein
MNIAASVAAGLHRSTAKQKNSPAAIRAAIASHETIMTKMSDDGNSAAADVPAIHRVAAFTGTAPFRWRASGSAVAARTETAYRLEASNCSVSLQRLETIEPMLIRDAAVDFALAHAP